MATIPRASAALALTAIVAILAGCGDPESASASGETTAKSTSSEPKRRSDTDQARTRTDAPPANWVRTKCTTCSCRVFSGDEPYCERPSCRHHWSEHKSRITPS